MRVTNGHAATGEAGRAGGLQPPYQPGSGGAAGVRTSETHEDFLTGVGEQWEAGPWHMAARGSAV